MLCLECDLCYECVVCFECIMYFKGNMCCVAVTEFMTVCVCVFTQIKFLDI